MRVFLTSAYQNCQTPEWLLENDPLSETIFTDDPEKADVIIFAENHPADDPYFRRVLHHEIYKTHKHKCVLYHDADRSITPLPTLSPSIEAWQFDPKHKRTAHYVARLCENDIINSGVPEFTKERRYLYNFIGGRTHKVRDALFEMEHSADVYLKDTTGFHAWQMTDDQKTAYELEYFRVMQDSLFVLSPRGIGPCTYRLFETLQLGRVPVIISDSWLKIPDIDWDKFSITIPESKIASIPSILIEMKGEAVEMGRIARQHWEDHFSPEVSLRHLSAAAKELIAHKYSLLDSLQDHSQFILNRWHLRNLVRSKLKAFRRTYNNLRTTETTDRDKAKDCVKN